MEENKCQFNTQLNLSLAAVREPNDPALTQLFDTLVLRGHLTPWLADWWELIRWGRAKKIVATWGQD